MYTAVVFAGFATEVPYHWIAVILLQKCPISEVPIWYIVLFAAGFIAEVPCIPRAARTKAEVRL